MGWPREGLSHFLFYRHSSFTLSGGENLLIRNGIFALHSPQLMS